MPIPVDMDRDTSAADITWGNRMIWTDQAFARRLADMIRRLETGSPSLSALRGAVPARLGNTALFFREWMRGPGMVGAVCSSSRYLAAEMAGLVPPGNGLVIELGAGTGMVTQALLDHGTSPRRLIIVERSEGFVAHLRHRFPEATVIHGDAANLCELIPQGLPVAAIVSSLPLRSLPADQRTQIIAQWRQVLNQDGSLIQFTYDIRPQAHTCASDRTFSVTHSRIVWANLPPARVLHARLSAQDDSPTKALAMDQPADPLP